MFDSYGLYSHGLDLRWRVRLLFADRRRLFGLRAVQVEQTRRTLDDPLALRTAAQLAVLRDRVSSARFTNPVYRHVCIGRCVWLVCKEDALPKRASRKSLVHNSTQPLTPNFNGTLDTKDSTEGLICQ